MASKPSNRRSGRIRLLKRYGAQAGVIAIGAVVAVASLENTRYLPRPPIIQRPFADVVRGRATAAANQPWNILGANVEHDRIAYWMNKLTTTARAGVEVALGRKSQYNEMIATKLEERHMPADLIYLAMIESEFNPKATSPVKAKGLWQFMASTARQFGLIVRGKTDERVNPEKATDAALTYLDALHKEFGSWYLAAAAYNSGSGTVHKALREVTGKTTGTDSDFFRILSRLPKETQDYVPKLIATARVGNDPAKYGLTVQESGGEVAPQLEAVPLVVDSATLKPAAPPAAKPAAKKSLAKNTVAKRTTKKRTTKKKRTTAKRSTTRKRSTRRR
jgi:hypothetical protein